MQYRINNYSYVPQSYIDPLSCSPASLRCMEDGGKDRGEGSSNTYIKLVCQPASMKCTVYIFVFRLLIFFLK